MAEPRQRRGTAVPRQKPERGERTSQREREPVRDGRTAALRVLSACRNRGADAVLREELDRDRLSAPDAALCTRLVYGVLQTRILLDFRLNALCTQRVEHLQAPLPDILRLGAYQILYLDRVPDRAAVSEAVELAKRSGRGKAAGLVNAVLRKLSDRRDVLPPLPPGNAGLSVRYSHPLWLVDRMVDLLGPEEAERFLAADNRDRDMTIQINPFRTSRDALARELTEHGVTVREGAEARELLLSGAGDVTALPAFRAGKFYVQDRAAAAVTDCAAPEPGQSVLDACAAPGGKSFGAAIAMEDRGTVLACDLSEKRLRRVREGADRLGFQSVRTEAADARTFRPAWADRFHAVLADVPCSGLGVIASKPDVRYKDPKALTALPAIQLAILRNVSRYVRPGGRLVYSTCTVLPEENEDIIREFLSDTPAFTPVPDCPARMYWPQRDGTDGFYICTLTRKS